MAADQAGEMSPLEILIQLLFVIVAGSDTTRGALAVQTAQLLQHREQWEAVCRDSRLVPGAVAEALRFEPSVHLYRASRSRTSTSMATFSTPANS